MEFLKNIDKDNIMLINVIYHNGKKETSYNDYLDIVYKELDTGNKKVVTIENPEMDIYFAKENCRNYDYNKSFIEMKDAETHRCKFKEMPFYIAKQAGDEYIRYVKNCIETKNRAGINNIHKYKYVFGSDYDIENWYRIQWYLNYTNDKPKPITKQFLDIEVDGIDVEGVPVDGVCPINAVTIVDEQSLSCHTFLLRNDKNPQIQEFEDTIDDFINDLHEAFDDVYGKLDYRIYMYDEDREIDLIRDIFKLINTMKRDFLMIWNMGYDIPYITGRIIELGYDPVEIMCHKDFKIKELFYKKDNLNFKVENKSDYFKISSYTYFADQMLLYAGLRKGQSELRSHALNYIAQVEIGDEKLDYHEEADIKTLPYVNYKKFVMYNIKDVLLQLGIEIKTHDIDNIYLRAYSNATSYYKIFKQTVFLKNRAYLEFYQQGLVIGNNVNIDYGISRYDSKDDDDEDEKFDGALVADPMLNCHTGIELLQHKSMFIFDNVVDMDFSSMYPHIIITFNVAPNCMIGKLVLNKEIKDMYNKKDIDNDKYDAGKDFVDNMLIKNVANMGTKWFKLPDVVELDSLVRNKFKIQDTTKIVMSKEQFSKYFLEGLKIVV